MALCGIFREDVRLNPLLFVVMAFGVACIGVVAGFHPHLLSPLTIPEAAAPVCNLRFLLIAVGVLLPMVIICRAYRYGIFRDKVRARQEV